MQIVHLREEEQARLVSELRISEGEKFVSFQVVYQDGTKRGIGAFRKEY